MGDVYVATGAADQAGRARRRDLYHSKEGVLGYRVAYGCAWGPADWVL